MDDSAAEREMVNDLRDLLSETEERLARIRDGWNGLLDRAWVVDGPAAGAEYDQVHAEALGVLRGATTFLLSTVDGDGQQQLTYGVNLPDPIACVYLTHLEESVRGLRAEYEEGTW